MRNRAHPCLLQTHSYFQSSSFTVLNVWISHTIPALDTELSVPPSQPVHLSSLGQMPAKVFLLDLPGLASFSFPPVPNYFCATLHTNTANASELCGLRKFQYYIPCVMCQDVKMLSKTSPKSALDEFHNKTINHIFLFSSLSPLPFTHAHRTVPYSQNLPLSSCSSLVNTFKQTGSLLSSVTLQPLTVTVHCLFLDRSLHSSAPSLLSLNRIRMVYCKNTIPCTLMGRCSD